MTTYDIPFVKMHGAGNDYIYVWMPNIHMLPATMLPQLAVKVSDRHFGIGADGLVCISPAGTHTADFRMRIFNADGSEAQMCGNASRCIGKYLYENSLTRNTEIRLATAAGIRILKLELADGKVSRVTVDMGEPVLDGKKIPATGINDGHISVTAGGKEFDIVPVGMGNPHGVVFTDEITDGLVEVYGPLLECAQVWPEKSNIEFVKAMPDGSLQMRVWERGSGETLACGTGSCAALVAGALTGRCERRATIHLRGGDLLVDWDEKSGHVFMTGPAQFIARGTYYFSV